MAEYLYDEITETAISRLLQKMVTDKMKTELGEKRLYIQHFQ